MYHHNKVVQVTDNELTKFRKILRLGAITTFTKMITSVDNRTTLEASSTKENYTTQRGDIQVTNITKVSFPSLKDQIFGLLDTVGEDTLAHLEAFTTNYKEAKIELHRITYLLATEFSEEDNDPFSYIKVCHILQ